MLVSMTNTAGARNPTPKSANAIVAANVRAEIGRADITQSELATALSQNDMWLSRRLKSNPAFSTDEVQAIADYFDVTPGELFVEKVRKPRGGGTSLVDATRRRSLHALVGPTGLEPMTSTVDDGRFGEVIPLFKSVA